MTTLDHADARKELAILLDKVRNHPSHNLSAERERIAVLQRVLALDHAAALP